MNVQISDRSLASLELVDAVDTGKQVACLVCIVRSAMCHAGSLCFGLVASRQCVHEADHKCLPRIAFNLWHNANMAVNIVWCAVCLVYGFHHGGAASAIKPV